MKKILIINGHPNQDSYCNALSAAYKKGTQSSDNQVYELVLRDMKFDLSLQNGYSKETALEDDLQIAQNKISWADHIVIIHPVWWGSIPALLKGFIDRTFLPGFAFKYRENSVMWDKLLSGKTGRIIYTTDTPIWIYRYFFNAPSVAQLKNRTLGFCGISSVKVTAIGPIRKSSTEFREANLKKVELLGQKGL